MIATVTPNPSVDRTLDVDGFAPGRLHRALHVHVHPGGKGVNVARALAAHGEEAHAIVPYGGAEGEQLLDLLAQRDFRVRAVPAGDRVRMNVAIVEPDGTVTKINEPGPTLTLADAEALLDAVRELARVATWVVTCGSVPPGLGTDFHARVVRAGRAAGVPVAVDASGDALLQAIAEGPDLVKPNRRELEEAVGRAVATLEEAVDAAQELRAAGAREVLASLGADGAVLVGEAGVLVGECAVAAVRSTVGAGDTLLAGYLAAGGGEPGLERGVSWAAESIGQPGTSLLAPAGASAPVVLLHHGLVAHQAHDNGRLVREESGE